MAMLTIHNIDDTLKKQIRTRAAENGRSMEEEVRQILQQAVTVSGSKKGLGSRTHQTVLELSGPIDLELPKRSIPGKSARFPQTSDTCSVSRE